MSSNTTYKVAAQGQQMRNAQKLYFQLAAVARKAKTTEAWTAANEQLKLSKKLEDEFDQWVNKIMEEAYPSLP